MSNPVHLAVDLGASSGRVIAGSMVDGKLTLEEVHRFANGPVPVQDSLQWNLLGLWGEILEGLRLAAGKYNNVRSVGVDTWGVDYALLDCHDQIVAPVRNYRDPRNEPMVRRAMEIMGHKGNASDSSASDSSADEGTVDRGRDAIFAATGVQFMQINTLYQMLAAVEAKDTSLGNADAFLMMGDFFHWLLTGKKSIESTMASTTQMVDAKTGQWAMELIESLGIPTKLFSSPIQPGTTLGTVQPSVAEITGLSDVPVIIPATHDTASAIISVPVKDFAPEKPDWCYISSGTWSLMGCELSSPRVNNLCSDLNFTNEGGVAGSTRLLKNIGGLWIFQQLREAVKRRGDEVSWGDMVEQAQQAKPFEFLVDPDAPEFVAPSDMMDAMDVFAARTGQANPTSQAMCFRSSLEGLALRYRVCLGMLEDLVGNRIDTVYIVGGGSMNELLCQMTADACNRTVVAGPVEATAIGNVVMQMIGAGSFGERSDVADSLIAAREMIQQSFEVKTFCPVDARSWDEPAERFIGLGS